MHFRSTATGIVEAKVMTVNVMVMMRHNITIVMIKC